MKKWKRFGIFVLALAMSIALLPTVKQAEAAQKKTIYVVTDVKVNEGGKITHITLDYTKNGLFKTIDSVYVDDHFKDSFTYKDNKLTKKVTVEGDGITTSYVYKDDRLSKKVEKGDDWKNIITYKYNSKGQISSYNDGHDTHKLTYKGAHVKKDVCDNFTYTATMDSNGNIKKWARKFGTETIGYSNNTFTYKDGRVTKLVRKFKPNPMWQKEKKQTLTFTYKKMSVPASLAASVEEQQWQFINDVPTQQIVAFAY